MALAALAVPAVAQTSASPRPRLAALAVEEAVVVDGVLDDPAWAGAEVGRDFVAREPEDDRPAAERTELSVVYTRSTLYFGIRAYDSEPGAIVAREMQRDADLGHNDDAITLVLDTFHDRRNSVSFEINPNGARTDALVTNQGDHVNVEWDGIWTVAARRNAQGWFAEVAIPFTTLRFKPGADTWGLNVRRVVRRTNEESNWAPIGREVGPRPNSRAYAAHWVSLAGELTGMAAVRTAHRLDVKPFVVGTASEQPRGAEGARRDQDLDVGLDLKWGVTRSLALDLTYNTDFAQVEVDEQQVNITRFSLFFPEKREFFLENAGTFEFGPPNRQSRQPPLLKAFFSRRIGLDGGLEVPIDLGARLTGRVGSWNLGVLAVGTGEVDEQGRAPVPQTEFAVLRVKRDLGRSSSLGLIATERDPDGPSFNRVAGLDLDLKPTPTSSLYFYGAVSDDQSDDDDGAAAFGSSFEYTTRNLRAGFDFAESQLGFDPGVGFELRDDYVRYNPSLRYEPRVNRGVLRSWTLEAELDYFERESLGVIESRRLLLAPIGMRTTGDDRFRIAWVSEAEQLFEDFEIRPGIVIPPGLYRFDSLFVRGFSNRGRRLSLEGNVNLGDFYDGERASLALTSTLRASRRIQGQLSWSWNDVELPRGEFTTNIYGLHFDVSWTPDLRLNTFAQYNDAAELVGLNVRFNWIYKPGANLFVVYNHNWDAPTFSARETARRELIVKYTYLWQP